MQVYASGAVRRSIAPFSPRLRGIFADNHQIPDLDHHTSATVKHPWAEDSYLMSPSRHFPRPPANPSRHVGLLDIHRETTRQGRAFADGDPSGQNDIAGVVTWHGGKADVAGLADPPSGSRSKGAPPNGTRFDSPAKADLKFYAK